MGINFYDVANDLLGTLPSGFEFIYVLLAFILLVFSLFIFLGIPLLIIMGVCQHD